MSKTRHIQIRMNNRAIRQEMICMALQFGAQQQNKVILNKKGLKALLDELRTMEKTAHDMMKKGGLVIVEDEGCLITTYNLNSFDRKKSRHCNA